MKIKIEEGLYDGFLVIANQECRQYVTELEEIIHKQIKNNDLKKRAKKLLRLLCTDRFD